LTTWEDKVDTNQPIYATILTTLKDRSAELIVLNSDLVTLQGQLLEKQTLLKVRIQEGTLDTSTLSAEIKVIEGQIAAKEAQITAKKAEITVINASLDAIHTDLDFINPINFTTAQLSELQTFIIGNTYTNPNIIKTDISTTVEIQEYSQTLYNQAVGILAKVSQPRYQFEINSINFIFLKEFQTFIDQLALGCLVTVEFADGHTVTPALLGIEWNYDNPTDFKMTFSNRMRLDDSAFQFSDLYNQTVSSGISTSFNSEQWSNWSTNYKDKVSEFITAALDTSRNMVTSGSNQDFYMDSNGFRGRKLIDIEKKTYDPEELWIINNMIAFTRDSWDHASLALGKISGSSVPGGGSAYGIVGDIIVGRLIAGNQLMITNRDSSFTVTGSSVNIINGELRFDRKNGNTQILLDPTYGIEISKRNYTTGSYAPQFYVDTDGNIIFTGTLSGANGDFTGTITASSGKIGAWTIDAYGLTNTYGDAIYGTGRVSLGNSRFKIDGDQLSFDGDIYARNLMDYVQGYQVQNIIAETIMAGRISGVEIFGGEISWPGVRMYSPQPGFSAMDASGAIVMSNQNGSIGIASGGIVITSTAGVQLGGLFGSGPTMIVGDLEVLDSNFNRGWGMTTNIPVQTSSGSYVMQFINGLLIDPYHYAGGTSGSIVPPPAVPGWHKKTMLSSGSSLPVIDYAAPVSGTINAGTLSASPVEYYFESKSVDIPTICNYRVATAKYTTVNTWGFMFITQLGINATVGAFGREIRYDSAGSPVWNNDWASVDSISFDESNSYDGYNRILFFHKPTNGASVHFAAMNFYNNPFLYMGSGWISANQPLPSYIDKIQDQAWEFGIAEWY
jgi:hypothetical protein